MTSPWPPIALRWISCRAEVLAAAFSTALAAYLVYGKAYDASRTGFSLEMAGEFLDVICVVVFYSRNCSLVQSHNPLDCALLQRI